MRPCASSCPRMVGMLRSTLVLRRFDQNPGSMVTARTGTLCSLAKGELARLSTPWSCHGINDSLGELASNKPSPEGCVALLSAKDSAGRAKTEAALEEAAVERNWRRDT